MDRIEEGMDKINQDIKEAEKNIDGLDKCCGLFVLPWRRQKLSGEGADAARDTWKKRAEGGAQLGDGPRIAISDDRPSSASGPLRCLALCCVTRLHCSFLSLSLLLSSLLLDQWSAI